jgi:nucleotide-binding universal stress UspA family protein
MSAPQQTLGPLTKAPSPFNHALCAVNDPRRAHAAAHQAARLVGSDGALTFFAVTDAPGIGPAAHVILSEARACEAVEAGQAAARSDGVDATATVVNATDVGSAILDGARDSDLLVVGGGDHTRVAGILLGSTTSLAVHRSPVPVLIARSHPELRFPGVVLVGTRGAEDLRSAIVAATIAARHGSRVILAHAGKSTVAVRHALAEQAVAVMEITRNRPVVVSVDGPPADRLPAMAGSMGAGLLVLGSRGRSGLRAIASVSERVAHRAPCSVLVLRPNVADEIAGGLPGDAEHYGATRGSSDPPPRIG